MSSRFHFEIASSEDDAELRAILRDTSMPGSIALSFQREPSFFTAEQAGSIGGQVVVYRDSSTGRILGFGSRNIRRVFVDGRETPVGYLSGLRAIPEARGHTGLARAYRHLHQIHRDGEAAFCFTTILDENVQAKELLTSGRAGLPVYQPLARMTTYLVPLRRKTRNGKILARGGADTQVAEITTASPETIGEAVKCLSSWNSQYQLAPAYHVEDFTRSSPMLPEFSHLNLYVMRQGGSVLGTLGVWDQQQFKQTIVASYAPRVARLRPLYNAFASLRGYPGLPPPGGSIRSLYAAFLSARENNLTVFQALLEKACADWSGRGFDYLVIGLCEGNSFCPVVERIACRKIGSTVYLVYWQGDTVTLPQEDRAVHLEVATL